MTTYRIRPPLRLACLLALVLSSPFLQGCGGEDGDADADSPLPGPQVVDPLSREGVGGEAPAHAPAAGPVATWTMSPPGAGPAPTREADDESAAPAPWAAMATVPAQAIQPTVAPPPMLTAGAPPGPDPHILAMMQDVRADRLEKDVASLVAFGTRHASSVSDEREGRGAGAARRWLVERFGQIGSREGSQILVEAEDFPLRLGGQSTQQENVIATLTGIGHRKRLLYVTAHYDSRIEDPLDGISDAPGADDDASGVAGLLELARVLSVRQWDASIRLVAFAAEEHALAGSAHHAPLARKVGLPIDAVFNNDVIGGGPGADGSIVSDRVRAFSATGDESGSRALARWARVVSARYGGLEVDVQDAVDRPGRGGDHQSFSEEGFAAIRLISAVEDEGRQHSPADTQDRLDPDYHAAVVRTNLALLASLALAPEAPTEAPRFEPGSSGGTWIRWTPTIGPDVAGYWLALRAPGEQVWRDIHWVAGTAAAGLELPQLAGSEPLIASLALDDGRGHMSLFGPEATR